MKALLLLPFLLIPFSAFSQTSLGIETQVYPAGVVSGVGFDVGFTSTLVLNTRLGYNFTNRRNLGKHDNEEGGGPGFSLGLKQTGFLTENLSINARTDIWFMEIEWRETETICGIVSCNPVTHLGASNVTILQPTIGIAYRIPNYEILSLGLSFGYEINVKTKGEPVGEGAILLAGIQLGFLLK